MNTENCGRLPAMSTAGPGFTAVCTHALKREGVKGKRAAVTLAAGRLVIAGDEGGAISIDPADIACLRVLHNEDRYTDYFHAHIVRTSRRDLLVLSPLTNRDPHYSATMRALAMAIALSGGMARIERGRSPYAAWQGTVVVGLLFLVGLCAGLFAGVLGFSGLADRVWWQRFGPAAALALLFFGMLWNAKARLAPRPIRDLGELDQWLPPANASP
jgi:hypothetical protein